MLGSSSSRESSLDRGRPWKYSLELKLKTLDYCQAHKGEFSPTVLFKEAAKKFNVGSGPAVKHWVKTEAKLRARAKEASLAKSDEKYCLERKLEVLDWYHGHVKRNLRRMPSMIEVARKFNVESGDLVSRWLDAEDELRASQRSKSTTSENRKESEKSDGSANNSAPASMTNVAPKTDSSPTSGVGAAAAPSSETASMSIGVPSLASSSSARVKEREVLSLESEPVDHTGDSTNVLRDSDTPKHGRATRGVSRSSSTSSTSMNSRVSKSNSGGGGGGGHTTASPSRSSNSPSSSSRSSSRPDTSKQITVSTSHPTGGETKQYVPRSAPPKSARAQKPVTKRRARRSRASSSSSKPQEYSLERKLEVLDWWKANGAQTRTAADKFGIRGPLLSGWIFQEESLRELMRKQTFSSKKEYEEKLQTSKQSQSLPDVLDSDSNLALSESDSETGSPRKINKDTGSASKIDCDGSPRKIEDLTLGMISRISCVFDLFQGHGVFSSPRRGKLSCDRRILHEITSIICVTACFGISIEKQCFI